jgi:hypothetical protein
MGKSISELIQAPERCGRRKPFLLDGSALFNRAGTV